MKVHCGSQGMSDFLRKGTELAFPPREKQPDGGPQVKKSVSSRSGLTGTPILDPWIPELWENKFLLFKPLSLWCSIMATSAG